MADHVEHDNRAALSALDRQRGADVTRADRRNRPRSCQGPCHGPCFREDVERFLKRGRAMREDHARLIGDAVRCRHAVWRVLTDGNPAYAVGGGR